MRLLVFEAKPRSRIAAVVNERLVVDPLAAVHSGVELGKCDLTALQDLRALLEARDEGIAFVAAAVRWAKGVLRRGERHVALLERDSLRLAPPLPPETTIIAMGRNFGRHVEEGNARRRRLGQEAIAASERPQAFLKLGRCAVGDRAIVPYPKVTSQLDYEGEVALVIGKPTYGVLPEHAMQYVAGYTILNDLSCRDIQRAETSGGLLLLAKNLPGSAPMGPELVLADEVPDPSALRIRTTVNGNLRQDATLEEMRFNWPTLISYWSQIGLRPGDVIAGGTPDGVALGRADDAWYLRPGDMIEIEVEGLGVLHTEIGTPT